MTVCTRFTYERWAAVVQASAGAASGDCARIVSRRDGQAPFFIGDVAGHVDMASHAVEREMWLPA